MPGLRIREPAAMRLTQLVASLPATVPFVGPEAQERAMGRRFVARLGANESVFGPSPAAVAAMAEAATEAWQYGDPELYDLKAALAAHHGVAPANIVVGEGIDGLLGLLVRLLVAPDTPVVTSAGAYPTFAYHVAGFGGRLVTIPYRDDAEDPEALLLAARKAGAPLLYLANPDNPMGSWHGGTPAMPCAFDRVRNHFGVGRIAQAGALAALADRDWLAHVVARVAAARRDIAAIATANGLRPLPSATNFVTIDCGRDGAFARTVLNGLVARGVFVRMPFVAPQDRCIRVTAGRAEDLAAFAAALPEALAAAG